MGKLKIVYKTEEMFHCEETEMRMSFVKPIAELWIGTKETEKLGNLVEWITQELKTRTWLKQDEKLKISKFDSYIIEFENTQKLRIDSKVYNLCKMSYDAVEQGETTWEHLIEII